MDSFRQGIEGRRCLLNSVANRAETMETFLTLAIVALTRALGTDGNRVDVGCRHVVAPTDVNAPRPPVARSPPVAKVIRPA